MRPSRPVPRGLPALLCLALAALAAAAPSKDEPPYRRVLSGDDRREVEALTKLLLAPQRADQRLETLKKIVEARTRAQGADHWETIDARKMLEDAEWRLSKADNGKAWQKATADEPAIARALNGGRPADPAAAARLLRDVLGVRLLVLPAGHHLTADVHHNLGCCLALEDRNREAEEPLREALKARRKALGEEHPKTASTYHSLGVVVARQSKHAEAEKCFAKAAEIRASVLGPNDPKTLESLAELSAARTYLPRKPAEDAKVEAKLLEGVQGGGESAATAHLHRNLAYYYQGRGRNADAEAHARKALVIRRRVLGENNRDTALSSSELGKILDDLGRHADAEPLLRKAVPILRERKKPLDPELATACNNLAAHLNNQGDHREAEKLLREALEAVRGLGDRHELTLQVANNLAVVFAAQGKAAEAGRQLDAVSKAAGKGSQAEAQAASNVGMILFARGEYEEAEKRLRLALDTFREALGTGHPLTAQARYNVAGCLLFRGKAAEAEPLHRQALEDASKALGADHPDAVRAGVNLAANLFALGRHDESEEILSQAAGRFETARLRAGSTGLRRSVVVGDRSPWPALAALQARRGKGLEAWRSLEKGMARGLFDDVSARQARRLDPEDRRRQQELIDALRQAEDRLAALKDTSEDRRRAEGLRRERDAALAALAQLEADVTARHGVVAGQVYSLERIQARMPADAALVAWVEYPAPRMRGVPAEHRACVLRRRGDPVWVRLPGSGSGGSWTDEDEGVLDRLRAVISDKDGRGWVDLRAKARALYLGPLREHLGARDDLPAVAQLVVAPAPDVPVDLLAGDDYAVNYAPSATLFAWLLERREAADVRPRGRPAALLALGDPAFHSWRRLRGTALEVRAISDEKLFERPTVLLDRDATREALDDMAAADKLREFDFIHLATHGQADPLNPLQSAVILPHSDEGGTYDSRLTAERILQTWKLDAELVSLSACESALGRYGNGEGYLGLSQALLLAGSRSLVLSLWQVDDTATALLMRRFYQNLRGARPGLERPMPRAQALAEARRWLAALSWNEVNRLGDELPRGREVAGARPRDGSGKPYEHPYYWAPFVLVGDPGEVRAGASEASAPPARGGGGLLLAASLVGGALALGAAGLLVWRRVRGCAVRRPPPLPPLPPPHAPSATATSGFDRTEAGVYFWFSGPNGVKSLGPIQRLEAGGEGRFYLVTQGGRHPIRLSQGQAAELERLLSQGAAAG